MPLTEVVHVRLRCLGCDGGVETFLDTYIDTRQPELFAFRFRDMQATLERHLKEQHSPKIGDE